MSSFFLLDENGNPSQVDVEEILTIRPTPEGPEFHTHRGVFYYAMTLEDFQALLKNNGFEKLDRTNLVHMDQAQWFDPDTRKVFFEYPATKESKFATVSEVNVHKVKHLIREEDSAYATKRKPLLGLRRGQT